MAMSPVTVDMIVVESGRVGITVVVVGLMRRVAVAVVGHAVYATSHAQLRMCRNRRLG